MGLGNPGDTYDGTPHNVGFEVLDRLAVRWGCAWRLRRRFSSRVARVRREGAELALVKPQTFMNCSGEAVGPAARYWGCRPQDVLVVVDDADLPLGGLRLRREGGSGGHRGLASLIAHLQSDAFGRVRVGVGRRAEGGDLAAQVLSRFADREREIVEAVVERACDAVACCVDTGMEEAMNRFNARRPPDERGSHDGTAGRGGMDVEKV